MKKRSALARAAANFNRRIQRELARNPAAAAYLPEKVFARELKPMIATTKERNRVIKELNRFRGEQMQKTVKTAKGFEVSKWELNRVQRANVKANQARQRELAMRDRQQNFITRAGEIEKIRLKPRAVDIGRIPGTEKGQEAWRAFARAELKAGSEKYMQAKTEKYKAAYIQMIRHNLGRAGQGLVEKIKKLPAEVVYMGQYQDPILTISFTSDPVSAHEVADMAAAHWDGFVSGLSSGSATAG
jgi:hypothetical protein